uniref:ARID domain-containing protein n=1 Tax=Steinernema glaseri TaxID=37863 RepID=A0A1I7YU06_9BILA
MAVADRRRKRTRKTAYVDQLLDSPAKMAKTNDFYRELNGFYRRKWGASLKLPNVDGFPFDLARLYEIVIDQGGWQKISSNEQWGDVAAALGYNQEITVVSHAIKQIYIRYLSKYEQNELIGEAEEVDAEAMAGRNRNGRMFSYLASSDCPVSVPPLNAEPINYLATQESEYGRLVKSLLSGLPNEVDFAINILTLLSHPGPRLFKVSSCPAIITILMAHVGIFADGQGDCTLKNLHDAWQEASGRDFLSFWKACGITDPEILRMVGFEHNNVVEELNQDRDLFNLPLAEFSTNDPISWRIFQILCIVRNLSFEEVNREALAENWPLIKFLLICAACDWPQLMTSALDTLSNIAYEMDITTDDMSASHHAILKLVHDCLHSSDKLKITRTMEIIAGLCNSERNENIICEFLSPDIMASIFSHVFLKDVMVCVYTLEALYQISELGTVACEQISQHPSAIDMLVDMTTVEAISFGPGGLSGMKVVEFNAPGASSSSTPSTMANMAQQPFQQVETSGSQYKPLVQRAPAPTILTNTAPRSIMSTDPAISQQHEIQHVQVMPTTLTTVGASPTLPNGPMVPQEEPQSKLDMLTVRWIRKNCIPTPGCSVNRGEVYAAYVNDMRNIYKSLSGSAGMFTNTLKACFRDVTVKPCEKAGSSYVHRSISNSHSPSPLSDFVDDEQEDPITSPLTNSLKSSDLQQTCPISDDLSEKLDSTIDAVASGKNGLNIQTNCNGVSYKHVNGVNEHISENGLDEHDDEDDMDDEMDGDDEDQEDFEEEDMGADEEDDDTSSMCSESVHSSVNGVTSHGIEPQNVYSNGHFSTSESESTGTAMENIAAETDPSTSEEGNLLCEWDNCLRLFSKGSTLFYHCATEHINENTVQCKWPNCDSTLRSRWSLVTHVQDHHCNEASLRNAAKRRQNGEPPEIVPKVVKEPTPAVYTKNAAAEAIRRHAFTYLPKDVTDENEGPVTKSIRLTSSLILRNLARYSSDGRRLLRRHESHISWLALSKLESGIALAQCLAELHESHAP